MGERLFVALLAVLCLQSAALGFIATVWLLKLQTLDGLIPSGTAIPHVLIGSIAAIAVYLWRSTEGKAFSVGPAILRAVLGGFFGFLGGQAAIGIEVNPHIQTLAAGVGGGTGPRAMDAALTHLEKK